MRYSSKDLALVVAFSAFGAALSVPVGYLGNYLGGIPALPLGMGQILSGIHIIPIALALLFTRHKGIATMTGAVKGLAEATLISFHGLPVIVMSAIQGAVLDIITYLFGLRSFALYLGCGLASASNVAFLQLFLMLPFPTEIYLFMYFIAFISGAVLGGYSSKALHGMVRKRVTFFG
jgi:ABC-type thiamin/hydroxymethylpyrimidine transport system permease subunit